MALSRPPRGSGPSASDGPDRQLNVLVVEDNALVRRMTRDLLAGFGCDVMSVADGAAARDALGYADAAIIDVGLPDCSGADLVEQVRWNDAALPVIVASARVDQELRDRFAADERTQLLPKPFTEDQLRAALDRVRSLARLRG